MLFAGSKRLKPDKLRLIRLKPRKGSGATKRLSRAAVFFARNSGEFFLAAEIRRGIRPADSYSQNV